MRAVNNDTRLMVCAYRRAPTRGVLGQWWGDFTSTIRLSETATSFHRITVGAWGADPIIRTGTTCTRAVAERGVVAEHVFDDRHMGAPGIAHGGAVTTVLDDMFGMLLYTVGEMAVTRRLDTEFHAPPVLLGTRYVITADLQRRRGRKLDVTARMEVATTGDLAASARALFIVVDLAHFTTSLTRAQSTTDIDQDLP